MKPLIIVCGPNHSGTSLVAKLLLNEGAILGRFSEEVDHSKLPYVKYEDKVFKAWCQWKIGFPKSKPVTDDEVVEYINNFDENRTLCLKYPKSTWVLHLLPEQIERRIKVVYVMRNPLLQMRSIVEKDATIKQAGALTNYSVTWDVISKSNLPVFNLMVERLHNATTRVMLGNFCEVGHIGPNPEINKFLEHRSVGKYYLFDISSKEIEDKR